MKFGIITLPVNCNFGGILQAYALQHCIEKLGHSAFIINPDYEEPHGIFEKLTIYIPRLFKKLILNRDIPIRRETIRKKWFDKHSANTSLFIAKHLKLCTIHSLNDLNSSEFDGFIVGSDQIWRKKYTEGLFGNSNIYDVFGAFLKNRKNRIFAYAPSFGVDTQEQYDEDDFKRIHKLLQNFTGVSCRENSGTHLLQTKFGYPDAVTVLDPTLLIESEGYLSLLGNYQNKVTCNQIVTYILDPNKTTESVIKKITDMMNKTSIEINNQNPDTPQYHVEYFLSSIADADFVVTDSFHATVFSIIFNKPFITIANPNRGVARVSNLLAKINLQSQLITSANEITSDILTPDVACAYNAIKNMRQFSLNFIIKSIAKIKNENTNLCS